MRRLVPTNWCFLVYWLFLVNVGPSFHHADLFGLHSHSHRSDHCGSHHSYYQDEGCCEHLHEAEKGHHHDLPQVWETFVASVFAPEGDCGCCKFFEQYNVCFNSVEFVGDQAFGTRLFYYADSLLSAGDLAALARGPPFFVALA